MRYGLVSDIHSNLAALERVLAQLDEDGIDRLICLGDVVGYGPSPNECCARLRERDCVTILGNHDLAALSDANDEYFNPLARSAIEWTRSALTPENRAYLASLPARRTLDGFAIVHGSPRRDFDYILDVRGAAQAFKATRAPVTFMGHSHVAEVYVFADNTIHRQALLHGGSIAIENDFRYLINPGSVGQPRDGNPQASFAIYDDAVQRVEVRRLTYDIDAVQRLMADARLPQALAMRLEVGM